MLVRLLRTVPIEGEVVALWQSESNKETVPPFQQSPIDKPQNSSDTERHMTR